VAIAAAGHRGQPGDAWWRPGQAITAAEAISASVSSSVAASAAASVAAPAAARRVAVGQPGDVALLDSDPLGCDPAGLRDMRVALTAVAGRVVHGEAA
jgi:predicted amidohydrolase YtcJ